MPRISGKCSCNWSGIFWAGFARNMLMSKPYCLSMAYRWGRGGGVSPSRLALQVTASDCFIEVEDGSREGSIDFLCHYLPPIGWSSWWCNLPCKTGIDWACNIFLEKFQDTFLKYKLLFISLPSYFTNLELGHKKRKDEKCSTGVGKSFCCLNFKLLFLFTCYWVSSILW